MDNTIIMNLVRKEEVTDDDIADGLYEICDEVHSSCGSSCPIYELGLHEGVGGCKYHKDGKLMLKDLRKYYEIMQEE